MENNFGKLIRAAMTARGLDRREMVKALGYRNTAKGFRRLDAWLAGECPRKPLFDQLVDILGLFPGDLKQAYKEDEQERMRLEALERAKDPRYHVYIPAFAGVAVKRYLDGGLSIEEALDEARRIAEGRRFMVITAENKRICCGR